MEAVVPAKVKAKAKGKGKADLRSVETVDIMDSGDENAAATAAARRSRAQKGKAASPSDPSPDSRIVTLERENQRIKRQLEQVRTHPYTTKLLSADNVPFVASGARRRSTRRIRTVPGKQRG